MCNEALRKKIFLALTLSIITALNCHAQLIHTSEFVKLSLPNGTYKLNKQQINALPGEKPVTKMDEQIRPPYIYNIDNIILSFHNVNQDSINNNLLGNKIFLDGLAGTFKRHGNNSYTSIIKNLNSKQVLIANYIINSAGYYDFYIQNAAKTLTLAGKMKYPKADAAKAEALNDIISNIQFTK
ncbi:hypothetical protein [Mucilaginibacter rigui]|uniref:hypothetical protein n=1 Tax=Mucilaginibacter rigui TaxID=534635 RepID=UPI0017461559|nr:hypothetical protein [Mucilaginibacter rigui]